MIWLPLLLSLAGASEPEVADGCPTTSAELPAKKDARLQGAAVIVVLKQDRRVGLYGNGTLKGCWQAGLASGYPAGHKQRRGDMKTPEGWYRTSDKPWSQFYGAIAVHYPEVADAQRGVQKDLITPAQRDAIVAALNNGEKPPQNTRLGGEILIHGGGGDTDWTLGCVALDNEELDVLRAGLPRSKRTDVLILP